MVAVKKNQPPTVQNTNKTVRDAPKMSHQPVGVWSECPAFREIKTAKISSEEPGRFSAKICTSENFPLYGRTLPSQNMRRQTAHNRPSSSNPLGEKGDILCLRQASCVYVPTLTSSVRHLACSSTKIWFSGALRSFAMQSEG